MSSLRTYCSNQNGVVKASEQSNLKILNEVLQISDNAETSRCLEEILTQPVLKTLETLNLGENNLQNRGIHTLRESLMMNHSLLQLGLEHTHFTCEGAVALAEFLAESRQIQRLDVRENEVRAGGLMALSLALRINHSLTSLDLDHTPKQEQEDFLMETQKSLLREISELCTGNAARHRIAVETELPWPDSSETR